LDWRINTFIIRIEKARNIFCFSRWWRKAWTAAPTRVNDRPTILCRPIRLSNNLLNIGSRIFGIDSRILVGFCQKKTCFLDRLGSIWVNNILPHKPFDQEMPQKSLAFVCPRIFRRQTNRKIKKSVEKFKYSVLGKNVRCLIKNMPNIRLRPTIRPTSNIRCR
jgi:hypothetical protein